MTVALILSILYGVIRTGKLEVILNLWAIVGIALLVLAIHELGHVVVGLIGGLNFKFMTVGPITFQKEKRKVRIRENKLWAYFGGVAMLVPPSIETPNLSKKWAWMTLGGPITSLLFGITSGYIYMVSYYQYLLYFSVLHFVIFTATIVPIKGTFLSDGMQFLILIKDDEKAKQHLYNIQVSSELFSYKRPKDWDERLIEISKEKLKEDKSIRDIMSGLMLVFYARADQEGMERAIPYIEPIVQLPVTKENKFFVSSFHSWYLLYKALYEMDRLSLQEAKEHGKAITKMDLNGYYRTQGIIKYLEGDMEASHIYMKKADKELKSAENSEMGYLQLEREWFEQLKKRVSYDG
ncbi:MULTISPECIES: M50 family metallopeptidase [Bacillus]|uniref:Cytolysin immunity CylI domain protein n=2 Tax=Bacillus cereus group TaxID=86661 RepID=Q72Y54_BACC1|nr:MULTISPECIES: M50 family metallopeptidase [Bacillus]AAS44068.1 cytolysin immunity CylI domain protein [Bacillus cereus ATCC 10987]KMQ36225.1 cytochrome C oxidase subunit II [Bacillus cereus]KXY78484.1 cytochrome C oxidase subunit II [Bacillus cereus]MCU5155613.1 M50 family metallopeptidase [Bacillus pacificus]MCU9943354.1 M50 family metallopeptidase [Bacillus pacificus]